MLRLQTLGSVFVTGDSGEPLLGAAAQRRTLALLAALAVAGDGGLSRDKIVGLLWPESDPERARHSLTQALYVARRALGTDDLFIVNADVRLNRARIACDVQELEAALDRGDFERAVALYTGPFLDGFFLSGSTEFEQWGSAQRARLEARVADALERLAEAAEEAGDHRRAVEWRRRLAALRPFDSAGAVKLMAALVQSGDRAGALQHARVHQLLLREQLGLEPDGALSDFVRKLREPSPPAEIAAGTAAGAAAGAATGAAPDAAGEFEVRTAGPVELVESGLAAPRSVVTVWTGEPPRRRWRWLVLGALVLLGLAAALVVVRRPRTAPVVRQLPVPQKLVVAPFRVVGAQHQLDYLRDGIVELLSTRLADDTAARAVDAGAVLGAWRDAGLASATAVPRGTIVRLAAQLGAERVVIGSVVGTPARVVLRASVLAVPSGVVSGEAAVEGPADSISALIEALAAKLLVSEAGEEEGLASITTASLPALRAYLAGQAALRRHSYASAVRQYDAALRYDSTFALAALQLAAAAERLNDGQQKLRGIALAWDARDALSRRDLASLMALAGPRYPRASLVSDQLAAWQRVVDLAPRSAESWYQLGAGLFHGGALAGIPDPDARAIAALEQALTLDSSYAPAGQLLIQLATRQAPARRVSDVALASALREPFGSLGPFLRWRLALAGGDTTALRHLTDTLPQLGPANLRAMAMASQYDGIGLAGGARALAMLHGKVRRRADRMDALLAQHSLALEQGRPGAAAEAATQLGALQPASHAHLRLRVLDALYAEGNRAAADSAAAALQALTAGGLAQGVFVSETRPADLCVLAQWRGAGADTAAVRTAVAVLKGEAAGGRSVALGAVPVSAAPGPCAELLDAWLAVFSRRPDALARLQRLDSLVLAPETVGDAAAYAPLLLAHLWERLGHPRRALQAIRRRAYMSGWPRYLATGWREEGRLAQLAGDRAGAEEAYRRYLTLRTAPEEGVAPAVEEVRRLLGALGTRGGR